jgi:hypothetical protein
MRTVASVEFAVRISVSSEPSVELTLDTEGFSTFAVSLVLVTCECDRCVRRASPLNTPRPPHPRALVLATSGVGDRCVLWVSPRNTPRPPRPPRPPRLT